MPNDERRLEPLTDAERTWIQANLRVACSLAKVHANDEGVEGLPSAASLDRAWSAWLVEWESTPEASRDDPNPIINAVGVAFGQHLVNELGLSWVIATDQYGTELAVHGDPGDILVFPANLVGKRFTNRATGFIAVLIEKMCSDIRRVQSPGD